MGDCRQMGKPSRCVASHPGQLSLAILLCSEYNRKLGHERNTARYANVVSVVLHCNLVSGVRKLRSTPLYGPYGFVTDFTFLLLR